MVCPSRINTIRVFFLTKFILVFPQAKERYGFMRPGPLAPPNDPECAEATLRELYVLNVAGHLGLEWPRRGVKRGPGRPGFDEACRSAVYTLFENATDEEFDALGVSRIPPSRPLGWAPWAVPVAHCGCRLGA